MSVSKAGSALIFECESDGEFVAINHIAHEHGSGADDGSGGGEGDDEAVDDTPNYTGPVFEELDDTLQQVRAGRVQQGRDITDEWQRICNAAREGQGRSAAGGYR